MQLTVDDCNGDLVRPELLSHCLSPQQGAALVQVSEELLQTPALLCSLANRLDDAIEEQRRRLPHTAIRSDRHADLIHELLDGCPPEQVHIHAAMVSAMITRLIRELALIQKQVEFETSLAEAAGETLFTPAHDRQSAIDAEFAERYSDWFCSAMADDLEAVRRDENFQGTDDHMGILRDMIAAGHATFDSVDLRDLFNATHDSSASNVPISKSAVNQAAVHYDLPI
ncbi:Uncharacterized protein PBTT_07515 [Plasmodiophora brassicae]|uniref:Uncharacterized protein n=1 Tax=Plasmodiophora brassicae TaxID=37360 RepID=A0A0G4IMM3_PLABS|nr:hypothetical protein PBRA_005026 [Plasmodiophora brassicae]SPQ99294.1 unnamed protein product [Plasmodiophora brassicae]